jgi:predicted dehydrogenase
MSGGGVLMELGVHVLDQLVFTIGAEGVRLSDVDGVVENGLDHHVQCTGFLTAGGEEIPCRATVSRLWNLDDGIMLRFERASVHFGIDPASEVHLTLSGSTDIYCLDRSLDRSGRPAVRSPSAAFAAIWDTFLDGLRRAEVTPAAASTGLVTTQWVEAIYRGLGND